MRKETEHYQET